MFFLSKCLFERVVNIYIYIICFEDPYILKYVFGGFFLCFFIRQYVFEKGGLR